MIDPALLNISLYDLIGISNQLNDAHTLDDHLLKTVDWIIQAHIKVADGGGISKGYDLLRSSWSPTYPETTGYTIPTLLNVAKVYNRSDLRSLALSLTHYLLRNTTMREVWFTGE